MYRIYCLDITRDYIQALNEHLDQRTEKQIKIALIDYFLPTCRFEGYSTASTPGSPSKFLMAAFVYAFAQKMTAEICPVQPFVMTSLH